MRWKLLGDWKLNQYFLYALGEILLVVLGILIALQVNNWNEKRKETKLGNELSSRLYQELLTTYEYSNERLKGIDRQIEYIDLILERGQNLNVDSVILASQEYWAVEKFTFSTYILFFTGFYNPLNNVYETSISDGSIKYVEDKEFVLALESIYINVLNSFNKLYQRETVSNENIEEYVSKNYGSFFEDHSNIKNGLCDQKTTKKLVNAMLYDGAFRFKLQQKNAKLKSKRAHVQGVVGLIEDIIINHDE